MMHAKFDSHFERALARTPENIRKKFYKQLLLLQQNLKHPSLRAKKYDESKNIWQARVDKSWRFYFQINNDIYYLLDIIPHPK